jgi:hypothetical protein
MRGTGQRQEVGFLALAVAVLAIAVALFVGVRALERPREQPAAEPTVEEPAAVETVEAGPAGDADRDPFKAQAGQGAEPGETASEAPDLRLVGIVMSGGRPLAVIRRGDRRYYAKVGEKAGPYTVIGVGQDQAILAKGDDTITLTLRRPLPEEEEE